MLNKTTVQLMALGLVGSFAATAAAQDSGALIDALVRKGVLKDQEAEQIRSQLSKDFAANTPAGKMNLSSSVKELKLSGDVRMRYQYDNRQDQADTGESQRTRYRLRLRVNADYKLSDDFFAGFGLQTEQKNDSGNQTMAGGNGTSATGTSASGDYFQNYSIYINKAFIGWNGIPGVTVIAGKQPNPLYTTDLVWDADINPTGITEKIEFNKFANLGPLELSLVGGQFMASDNNEYSASGKTNRDAIIYHTQLVAGLKLTDDVKLTVAPGYYTSNGAAVAGDGGGEANWTSWSSTGTEQLRGLKIYTAPGDVSFKIAGKPVKFQWDLAWNADANNRSSLYSSSTTTTISGATSGQTIPGYTETALKSTLSTYTATVGGATFTAAKGQTFAGYTETSTAGTATGKSDYNKTTTTTVTPSDRDSLAYLVGFQIGENKKKGDWSLLANYRQVGLSAVDPNINDSDWALSYTNMAGYKVGFFYNLGDATTIGSTFYSANNLRSDLGAVGASAGPGSKYNAVQVLQVDLSVKF